MAEKKSPWAAIGIGCLVVAAIGVVVVVLLIGWCKKKADDFVKDFEENPAKAAAELVVKMNPELEMVSSDDEAGTITVREKKTGKVTTVDFEDAKEGKFTITADDGTKATFDGKAGQMTAEGPDGKSTFNVGGLEKMPKWFEVPAGVTDWKSLMHQERDGKVSGMVNGKTTQDANEVFDAFEANLKLEGFERTAKTETQAALIGNFRNKEEGRTIGLTINMSTAEKVVSITYNGR